MSTCVMSLLTVAAIPVTLFCLYHLYGLAMRLAPRIRSWQMPKLPSLEPAFQALARWVPRFAVGAGAIAVAALLFVGWRNAEPCHTKAAAVPVVEAPILACLK